jgi:hypothetical protein
MSSCQKVPKVGHHFRKIMRFKDQSYEKCQNNKKCFPGLMSSTEKKTQIVFDIKN